MSLREKEGWSFSFANEHRSIYEGEISVHSDGQPCLQNFKAKHYNIFNYFKILPHESLTELFGTTFSQSALPCLFVSVFTASSGLF